MPTSGLQDSPPIEAETVLLWGQVAAAAAVPLALMLCQLGLAVGTPVLPPALEVGLLGVLPIAALIWVQWRRPFYPFQIWVQYQAPETLTERQRRWLSRLLPLPHQPWWHPHGWLAVVSGGVIYVGFRRLYATVPVMEAVTFLPPYGRLLGVLWAVVWVAVATVLLQGAVAAARLLLLAGEGGTPLGIAQIRPRFTFWGQEGGAVLRVLGVPQPIDNAGRAVMEPSAAGGLPEALASEPPKEQLEASGMPVVVDAGGTKPADTETASLESTAGSSGSGATSESVAIEPLATPVFVNILDSTP